MPDALPHHRFTPRPALKALATALLMAGSFWANTDSLVRLWPVVFVVAAGCACVVLRAGRSSLASSQARPVGLLFCCAFGALLYGMIPISPATRPPQMQHLEIVATAERNPQAKAAEVWIAGVYRGEGKRIPYSAFVKDAEWEVRDRALVWWQPRPGTIRWSGRLASDVRVLLGAGPWSGKVRVIWNGRTIEEDLYSPVASGKTVALPLPPFPRWLSVAYAAGCVGRDVLAFGLVLWGGLRMLSVVFACPSRRSSNSSAWAYVLPCVVVWGVCLVAYWPGLLSPDSLWQWEQMLTGRYDDSNPVFHTLFMFVLTRLWHSPAIVALVQIVSLAALTGFMLSRMRRQGMPRWLAIATCAAVALLPPNGVMAVTLWKDVPYSIAVLLLTALMFQTLVSGGGWLRGKVNWLVLGLTVASVTLLRHNGFAVAAGTFVVALVMYRRFWVRIAGAAVVCALAVGAVKGPAYSAVGVERPNMSTGLGAMVFATLAAHIEYETALKPEETEFLYRIRPREAWVYDPYYVDVPFADGKLDRGFLLSHGRESWALLWELTKRAPWTTAHGLLDRASLVWRITPPLKGGYYQTALESQEEPRVVAAYERFGFAASPFPQLKGWLTDLVFATQGPRLQWFLWRPALQLFALLFAMAAAFRRRRNWGVLAVATPALCNAAFYMVLAPAQDFRYQYAVYVTALLLVPYLLWSATGARDESVCSSEDSPTGAAAAACERGGTACVSFM